MELHLVSLIGCRSVTTQLPHLAEVPVTLVK
jgi:hypothetical protein